MKKLFWFGLIVLSISVPVLAQKSAAKAPNKVIFAVIDDGQTLEPVAKIEKGKLLQTVTGGDEPNILIAFNKTYYRPKTNYNLIFGGSVAGTVSVVKNDPSSDCGKNLANVTLNSTKAKLKGFVMALATNLTPAKAGSGLRRLPTAAERAEIEKLVTGEFGKHKISGKKLEYHNLTALDVDNDKTPELVGSFWVTISATERGRLFFIADKGKSGRYSLTFSEFEDIKENDVMSKDIKDVDGGIYHELLLDVLDYNGDGVAEVFTYTQSFEGAGFNAYQRKGGGWQRILETSNYHCAY